MGFTKKQRREQKKQQFDRKIASKMSRRKTPSLVKEHAKDDQPDQKETMEVSEPDHLPDQVPHA